MKCDKCGKEQDNRYLRIRKYVCPECGAYMKMPARERISLFTDKNSFTPWFEDIKTSNVLGVEGYEEKIETAQKATGLSEAVLIGKAQVYGRDVCIGVCDAAFMMGSMGRALGERVTAAIERATEEKLPIFMFCCSGGARMQEGIISLMQMEKTAAAVAKNDEAGGFYCTILTNPTMGGMTASFAMLGDIILAEPGAVIGFAGQRVIKQTIGKELPEGFQTAEFQEKHGMVDGIVERKRLKQVMLFLTLTNKKNDTYANFSKNDIDNPWLKTHPVDLMSSQRTAWEKVKRIRGTERPSTLEYVDEIFDIFVELKGDRLYGNDNALVGGIAMIDGQPVTVLAEQRGKDLNEAIDRNFGMPNPEGYRKALRLMKQAEKFNRPIVSFINTPGAYCGIEAEERGQGEAIARNLFEMSKLRVPILSIIVGEAGSGGALATAIGNEVWMFENATYSILTPEGYASILWKDSSRAEEAAENMHIVAKDLQKLGVIEDIIPEFGGATSENVSEISTYLKLKIRMFMEEYSKKSRTRIRDERYDRFRKL